MRRAAGTVNLRGETNGVTVVMPGLSPAEWCGMGVAGVHEGRSFLDAATAGKGVGDIVLMAGTLVEPPS